MNEWMKLSHFPPDWISMNIFSWNLVWHEMKDEERNRERENKFSIYSYFPRGFWGYLNVRLALVISCSSLFLFSWSWRFNCRYSLTNRGRGPRELIHTYLCTGKLRFCSIFLKLSEKCCILGKSRKNLDKIERDSAKIQQKSGKFCKILCKK